MKYKNHFQCLIKSAQFIYVLLSKKINPLFSQFKYLASHECSLPRRKPCILSIYISLILSLVFLKPSFPQIIVRQDNFVQPQRATFMNIFCSLTKRRPTKDPTYRQKFTECLQPALTFSFQIRLKTKRIYIYTQRRYNSILPFSGKSELEGQTRRGGAGPIASNQNDRMCSYIPLTVCDWHALNVDYRGLPPRHDFPDQVQSHQTVQRYLVGPGPTGACPFPITIITINWFDLA